MKKLHLLFIFISIFFFSVAAPSLICTTIVSISDTDEFLLDLSLMAISATAAFIAIAAKQNDD
ncbi:hypothetical protein A2368_04465 [Candidatus Collierbacteria bacterium RIFOXYB1_FULL_49_13]|uniref:Uncharacterized protein n=1 Tax=Candidatus Collierbacteria bacterium RIFOXYB1_FULL_49_13 TaxID=1817728 RepID=A0A1F5FJQ8_9BACT|nr:MAG: hypothetical protein A2368_04465 [Candidatus Collierbacteria bacterium RIFOXYB1_FULL_49_13]